jgi:SAM-dependent methyltransferase
LHGSVRLLILPTTTLRDEFERISMDGGHNLTSRPLQVLSLGPGLGAVERFLGRSMQEVAFTGLELDADTAAAATAARFDRLEVASGDITDPGTLPGKVFDGVLVIDVIHHVPPAQRAAVIASLASHLRPGGFILVKDIASTPRWKASVNFLHDLVMAGEKVAAVDVPCLESALAAAGFSDPQSARCDRWSPYSHVVTSARLALDEPTPD